MNNFKNYTATPFVVASFFFFCVAAPLFAADHSLFSRVLRKHVSKNGMVNYKALKKSLLLPRYIQQLSSTNPNRIQGKSKKLAFWINAYNAFTLKLIVEHYPLKSITDLHLGSSRVLGSALAKTVWKRWKFTIYKKKYTLDHIEHKIIRPQFREPRVHAALVCAAKSCPPLRREAYRGSKLNQQLSRQMRQWLGNPKLNRFNSSNQTLYLSKIFNWFKEDFSKSGQAGVVKKILPYFPQKIQRRIKKLKVGQLRVQYLDYDWSLNET